MTVRPNLSTKQEWSDCRDLRPVGRAVGREALDEVFTLLCGFEA